MYEWNGDGIERKRDAMQVQIHAPPRDPASLATP
jgi:hypothetical protein